MAELFPPSFKFHASCRHTHPAADALLQVMQTNHLQFTDLAHITTHVHQGAIDVLGAVTDPKTVHQSKFSMGTVLAIVAKYGHAGLDEFENHFLDPEICQLRDNVSMQLDPQVDQAYPQRWIGKVSVKQKMNAVKLKSTLSNFSLMLNQLQKLKQRFIKNMRLGPMNLKFWV